MKPGQPAYSAQSASSRSNTVSQVGTSRSVSPAVSWSAFLRVNGERAHGNDVLANTTDGKTVSNRPEEFSGGNTEYRVSAGVERWNLSLQTASV
ncbi:MAG: hypothetical protein RR212_04650 [Bacteroidales bacterium]